MKTFLKSTKTHKPQSLKLKNKRARFPNWMKNLTLRHSESHWNSLIKNSDKSNPASFWGLKTLQRRNTNAQWLHKDRIFNVNSFWVLKTFKKLKRVLAKNCKKKQLKRLYWKVLRKLGLMRLSKLVLR